jgi:outer membrane protein OmpA-like peptidoglycan-associated protein
VDRTRRLSTFVVMLALVMAAAPAKAQECSLLTPFNQAIQNRDLRSAKVLEAKIATDAACGPLTGRVRLQRVLLETTMAESLSDQPGRSAEREDLLVSAAQPGLFWGASASLGDLRFSQRRFADATLAFEQAIEIAVNPALTPKPVDASMIKRIYDRAAEARLLAANEENAGASYVPVGKDNRGEIAGMYSVNTRGPTPESIPVPINFDTNSARMTPIGEQAADELATAIKSQHPSKVIIVGHADVRGSDAYNLRLSERRAQAVRDFLLSRGVNATITIIGRGKREPLQIDDKTGLTQEDVWAMNRRVEWRRTAEQE